MIVDTHTHVVAPDERAYPLSPRPLSGEWYRETPCSAEGLLQRMDAVGVERAILVQALGAYSYDNRYVTDSAAAHPNRFIAACCIDPDAKDPVGELSFQVEERGACGSPPSRRAAPGSPRNAPFRCGSAPRSWART